MELIALVSSGKGSWSQVAGLISRGDWENIIVMGSDFFMSKFEVQGDKKVEKIIVDTDKKLMELKEEIGNKLKGKIRGTEVALSIASGDGKEHMALIAALLNLPVGVRFAVLTQEGIKTL